MGSLRIVPALALGVALGLCPSASAKTAFISSKIEGQGTEIVFGDLDGDHLKDAVLIDGLNLSVFYQDRKQGFPRAPQQKYRLDSRPSVVWAARLGGPAESLLVMTQRRGDGALFYQSDRCARQPADHQTANDYSERPG